jgi:outer membrane protein assembly factor BamB
VANGIVYFGDLQGTVFAVDAVEGSTQWTFEAGGAIRGTPVVSGDTLMVMIDGGTVYALNIADGAKKWEHVIDEKNADRLLSNPVVVGDKLLIVPLTADQLIYALKIADGTEAWTYKP